MEQSYGERYADLYRRHWWWRAREEEILHEVRRLRADLGPARILDVGCGDALLFDRLLPFGQVEGVEPEAGLVSGVSRQRYKIYLGALDDSYPESGSFDLILFLDVLEHLDDPGGALILARERLAPGGAILVTVPAYAWLWTCHDSMNHHRMRYSPLQLQTLAQQAGCEVVRLRHMFMWLVAGKLLVRLCEYLRPATAKVPRPPHPAVNGVLLAICRVESVLSKVTPPPVGSSILAVILPASESYDRDRDG